MEKRFVVTFRFLDGTKQVIVGDGIKSVMEQAREMAAAQNVVCYDLEVRVVPQFGRQAYA